MHPNINANNWMKACLMICILTYLYFVARKLHLQNIADDQFFLAIFNSGHMFEKVIQRYTTWTGRFPLELLMTATIGFKLFWKLAIPISVVVLCYSICRIIYNKVSLTTFALCMFFFASIPSDINNDASWWVTGFYNYLLPVTLCVYTFSISYSCSNNRLEKILCLLFSFYFSYMEQAGIAYVVALFILLMFKKEKRNCFNFFLLLIVAFNLIICLKAPGNENRFSLESWTWFPQYQTYGIFNKLSLGFDKLHQLMTFKFNIPLIGLAISLILARSIGEKMRVSIKISMIVIISFVALSIANSLTSFFTTSSFFFNTTLNASNWSSAKIYFSYLYLLIVISSMFNIMLEMFASNKISLTPVTSMLIGFMTVTMMGMSPTVYASGLRVDFLFEIMCIISCMYFLKSFTSSPTQLIK